MGKTDAERQQRRRAKLREAQEQRRQERGLRVCPHCAGWLDLSVYAKTEWDRFARASDEHRTAGTELPIEESPVKLVEDADIVTFIGAAEDWGAP